MVTRRTGLIIINTPFMMMMMMIMIMILIMMMMMMMVMMVMMLMMTVTQAGKNMKPKGFSEGFRGV